MNLLHLKEILIKIEMLNKKSLMRFIMLVAVVALQSTISLYASNFPSTIVSESKFTADDQEKVVSNVKVFFNPISQQITVSLKLNKQNTVIIKVMDALGNEVLALMNGALEVGNQNLNFDTNEKLTAGFYFVRVSVGAEAVVKRISVR